MIFIILSMTACATPTKRPPKQVNIQKIESLPLGSSETAAIRTVGEPAERVANPSGADDLIYVDPSTKAQVAVLGFSGRPSSLRSKGFHPDAVDPESRLSFLLEEKYRGRRFEKIQVPRCGFDFSKPDVYLSKEDGIIVYQLEEGRVDYIFWMNPEEFESTRKSLATCRKTVSQ